MKLSIFIWTLVAILIAAECEEEINTADMLSTEFVTDNYLREYSNNYEELSTPICPRGMKFHKLTWTCIDQENDYKTPEDMIPQTSMTDYN